jgi:hypothetical protein
MLPATAMSPGHDMVSVPVASVVVWLVTVSRMFEHCDRLAGNVASPLMVATDIQVPTSDPFALVGLTDPVPGAIEFAGRLVGATTLD